MKKARKTRANSPKHDPELVPAGDVEAIQAVVLAAAVNGNQAIRAQLPTMLSTFEEPYRTVAAKIVSETAEGQFPDRRTIGVALDACHLIRCTATGIVQELTAQDVAGLLFATEAQPGQVEAYMRALQLQQKEKQQADLKEVVVNLAKTLGDRPEVLLAEVERLVSEARKTGSVGEDFPAELLELFPYLAKLTEQQSGNEFLGLDSGFPHFNNLCNGLDTGLAVMAAPPGAGKTTWCWQTACQAAELNRFPVIFVSLEQSKKELRAKALARLSKLQYRHILRGRLRADDEQNRKKLLDAAKAYAHSAAYLTIVEGDDTTTIDKIHEIAAAKMAKADAKRCLIVLDYLQVLPLRLVDGARATSTKDRVDLHVSALRRIARRLDSPVLAISSENRAGYKSKQVDVFKESGGIEYSADIAMVLTPDKQGEPPPGSEFRSMDLNVVKNRNGERGVIKFKFYPQRAEFIEVGKGSLADETEE
jgi:replicative DNA helicase